MAKLTKQFQFCIPVTATGKSNSRLTQTHIGNIEIDAVATFYFNEDPDIDYNSIKWNGTDIFPLLDNFSGADDILQEIHNAAHAHILKNFSVDTLNNLVKEEVCHG